VPGSYVKHAKYGRGLVLRREGVGDSLKLTVTFPGYGQKSLFRNMQVWNRPKPVSGLDKNMSRRAQSALGDG